MQLKALLYFDELVRTKSMRQAAENLNVAPTAISRQIENLEEHFGAPLVERSTRGVTLTAAGELLASQAGRTLRELDYVERLIEDLKDLERGRVNIYASGASVAYLLGPALAAFSLQYPKLRFEVTIGSAPQAVEAVRDAFADMAITLFTPPAPDLDIRLHAEVRYDLIVGAAHPLACKKQVSLDDVLHVSLALPDGSFGFRQSFDALLRKERASVDPLFVTSSLEMLRELMLQGVAATLLPAQTMLRDIKAGRLVAVPLEDSAAIRTRIDLLIAPDRQLSFAAKKLIGFLDEFMREQVAR
ncbi:LysR family transcriptional regulator [Oryzifoliimicrobium ureilyticus]|uniref:LysR family transcriptional regulator n=1 Tax=Oryzifoliimicrobium ureilyticus TaxID=3113724 RepID=UPI003076725F